MSEIDEETIARLLFERSRMSPADPETWEQADYDMRAWLLGHARAVLALVHPAIEQARVEERERAAQITNSITPIMGFTIGMGAGLWADARGNTKFVAMADVNEQLEQRAAAIRKG